MNHSAGLALVTLALLTGSLANQSVQAHEGPGWMNGCMPWHGDCGPMGPGYYGRWPAMIGMGPGFGPGLDLSRKQRDSIRDIMDEMRPKMRALMDRIAAKRQILYEAIADKRGDKEVREITKQLGDLIADSIVLNIEYRTRFDKVLTAGQRSRHYPYYFSWLDY